MDPDVNENYLRIIKKDKIDVYTVCFGTALNRDVNFKVYYCDKDLKSKLGEHTFKVKRGSATLEIKSDQFDGDVAVVGIPQDVVTYFYITALNIESRNIYLQIITYIVATLISGLVTFLIERALIKKEDRAKKRAEYTGNNKYIILGAVGILICSFACNYLMHDLFGTSISYKVVALCALMIAIFLGCFLLRVNTERDLNLSIFIIILATSSLFSLGEPATNGMCYDDVVHYSNIVLPGNLISKESSYSDAVIVSDAFYAPVAGMQKGYDVLSTHNRNTLLNTLDKEGYVTPIKTGNIGYSVIGYLHYIVAYVLLKGLPIPWSIRFAIIRFMNSLLYSIMAYLAIRKIKSGKILLFATLMLPIGILLSGNYTYDTFIISMITYSICSFVKECENENETINLTSYISIYLPLALASVIKPVYFPLALVYLMLPLKKYSKKTDFWKNFGFAVLSALVAIVIIIIFNYLSVSSGGDSRGGVGINPGEQLKYIIANPIIVGKVIFDYLKIYFNPFAIMGGYGLTNLYANMGVSRLPGFVLSFVIIVAIIDSYYKPRLKTSVFVKISMVIVYIVSAIGTCLALYISFCPVGSNSISGVQPRYLLPLIFPLFFLLTRGWANDKKSFERVLSYDVFVRIVFFVMVFANTFGFASLCLRRF